MGVQLGDQLLLILETHIEQQRVDQREACRVGVNKVKPAKRHEKAVIRKIHPGGVVPVGKRNDAKSTLP